MLLLMLALFAAALLHSGEEPAHAGGEAKVRWQAWGTRAFDEAQRLQRPLLLWIAPRWSAATRQMEREVFDDPKAARMVNALCVPVRVEPERHPDLDVRCQQAVRACGGPTGWPLTVFLTPEGGVLWRTQADALQLYGGTAFTLEDDFVHERDGFLTVLSRVTGAWRDDRDGVLKEARALEDFLRRTGDGVEQPKPAPPSKDALTQLGANMCEAFDPHYGGFGAGAEGPRHLMPQALELALVFYARTGNGKYLEIVTRTLDTMLEGGIYDRLVGGFHRMALDRRWRVPRFEKLLATDAEIVPLLLHAWQASGRETYVQAARQTLAWRIQEQSDHERGGFFASQVSDEAFYTWTVKEVEAALRDASVCTLVGAFYGIGELGDLPESSPHRNLLFQVQDLTQAARTAGVKHESAPALLKEALAKLGAVRSKRRPPTVDRGILIADNARMVSALLEAHQTLGEVTFRAAALKTLDRLLKEGMDAGRGVAHHIESDGQKTFLYLAADEVALACACQDAYMVSGEARYLDAASACLARLDKSFTDASGAVYDRASDAPVTPNVASRMGDTDKPFTDLPGPSVNALAIQANLRMASLSGVAQGVERARTIRDVFGPLLTALGGPASSVPLASEAVDNGVTLVVVEGPLGSEATQALRHAAGTAYAPHKLMVTVEPGHGAARAKLGLKDTPSAQVPTLYVFLGARFAGSVTEPSKVKALLAKAAKLF